MPQIVNENKNLPVANRHDSYGPEEYVGIPRFPVSKL